MRGESVIVLLLWAVVALAMMTEAVQFRSRLAPNMCAAGKSVWVAATGSGPRT